MYYVDCDLCDRQAAFLGLPTRRTWFESRLEQLWPSVEGSGPFYRWPHLKEPIFIWKCVFHMGATPAPRHHPSESNLKVPDFFKRLREVIQCVFHQLMWHTESYNAMIKEVLDNSEHIPVTRKKDINKNCNSTETSFIGEGLVIRYNNTAFGKRKFGLFHISI